MAGNLLKIVKENKIRIADTKIAVSNYLSSSLKNIDKEKDSAIKELENLRDNFKNKEIEAYAKICGRSFSNSEDAYSAFQDHIAQVFLSNRDLFNDIQKIAVRKSNASQGIETLRDLSAEMFNKESGISKVVLSPDEIYEVLSSVLPDESPNTNVNDAQFHDFLNNNINWKEAFDAGAAIKKKIGNIQGSRIDDVMIGAVREAFGKIDVSITEDNLKENLLPFYRNFFLNEFSNELKKAVNTLVKNGAIIRAEEKKGKTTLEGGLLPAIISARKKAIENTNEFFYEGNGTSFTMAINGKMVTIESIKSKGMFTKLQDNFANTLTDHIRDALTIKIVQKQEERKSKSKISLPDFSNRDSTVEWLKNTFEFSSVAENIIRDAIPLDGAREYFNSVSPMQIIGDLSEVLYSAFLNQLNPSNAKVTSLGGGRKYYSKETLENLDSVTARWKQGKQPAVDLLLNNEYGIQVKNAFTKGALSTHSISFISEKSLDTLFLQEFRDLPDRDSLKEVTAEAILLEEAGYDTVSIWKLLVRIYSYFMDVILDLGTYDADIFAGDKNLFYLYLSQYLIPASALIQSAIDELKKKGGNPPIKIQRSFKVEENKNLTEQARMGIDYTFYNDFIKGFDILQKALDLQQ